MLIRLPWSHWLTAKYTGTHVLYCRDIRWRIVNQSNYYWQIKLIVLIQNNKNYIIIFVTFLGTLFPKHTFWHSTTHNSFFLIFTYRTYTYVKSVPDSTPDLVTLVCLEMSHATVAISQYWTLNEGWTDIVIAKAYYEDYYLYFWVWYQ